MQQQLTAEPNTEESNTAEVIVPNRKNGCYTMHIRDLPKWKHVLEQYYFWTTSASPDSIDSVDWNETTPGRLYIHYTPEGGVLHTFTLFSNGTFMVQGEAKTLDAWRNTHFPELNERYMNSTDIFVPSDEATTTGLINHLHAMMLLSIIHPTNSIQTTHQLSLLPFNYLFVKHQHSPQETMHK